MLEMIRHQFQFNRALNIGLDAKRNICPLVAPNTELRLCGWPNFERTQLFALTEIGVFDALHVSRQRFRMRSQPESNHRTARVVGIEDKLLYHKPCNLYSVNFC